MLLLFLERSGYADETYHTFSYSPLSDDDGRTAGMFCVVMEETERVIGERRLASLREIAAELATSRQSEVLAAVERSVSQNPRDLPFTLLYLFDESGRARLAALTCIKAGHAAAVAIIEPQDAVGPWPVTQMLSGAATVIVDDLAERFDTLPGGAWDRPPGEAAVVPVGQPGQERAAGFLVVGLNPYRRFDAGCAGLIGLVGGKIASSLPTARASARCASSATAM